MPRSSATNRPATWRCTRAVTMTAPGSASACTRAAMLGVSPKISPSASTTTGPVSRPMRASSDGLPEPAFFAVQFERAHAGSQAPPARRAPIVLLRHRIAEQRHQFRRPASWRHGRPFPPPPPKPRRYRRRPDRAIPRHRAAQKMLVEPTRSQNITVRCRRSPALRPGLEIGGDATVTGIGAGMTGGGPRAAAGALPKSAIASSSFLADGPTTRRPCP